ncbi:MAG: capsular polysaccharide biosynthesis protein [Rhodobacteraceae bacterium]|nr:capsular polysaccharide biosynthesis protein [Paracoccaceae bacterium]MBR9822326.1 capsular polysaccharide biosynthesis protein [Paracoccaceae bacterium]
MTPEAAPQSDPSESATGELQPLHFYNAGFLRQKRVRRTLELSGYRLTPLGDPGPGGLIGVWGHSPYAKRGEAVAEKSGASLLRIEDAFLRSLQPGRMGEPPLGLTLDRTGCHFDGTAPSDLERLLKTHPFDDGALLNRARGLRARMREAHLSKYAACDPDLPLPDPGYVLVIDQLRGDASVRLGGADANTFKEMLYWAQEDHPGARIVIKTHPETQGGKRDGYYGAADVAAAAPGRITLLDTPVSPWLLLEGAVAVYTVSSQLGFEAILAGHRPRVFGLPFYAGWDLSDDRHPLPPGPSRRGRRLTRTQLTAGALLLYPRWYDPYEDRLCGAEEAAEALAARARAWREDRHGWRASNIRLWKRRHFQAFFGQDSRMRFSPGTGPQRQMSWGGATRGAVGVEDGFLRSRGLGAELVPPLSLTLDDLGIYYDPRRESRLERLITARAELRPDQLLRIERLIATIRKSGLSKYNLEGAATLPRLRPGRRVLVPGQVEDDASVLCGAGPVRSNLELLQAVRKVEPDAVVLYKPHPDVERGLRPGRLEDDQALAYADEILTAADPAALLEQVDAVWTMTSLMGFEALLRGVEVICTGLPFYAGWGLTRDLDHVPRRRARVSLESLAHAALIDYPRYLDPVTRLPCPVEVAVRRLQQPGGSDAGPGLRALSKAQGLLASRPGLWR